MEEFKDFEFKADWHNKDRWNLCYVGSDSEIIIPAELIAQAGKPVGINLSTDNKEITGITFPDNVIDVWFGMFYGDKELTAIHVDPNNPFMKEMDGILFSKDEKTLIQAPTKMQGEYIVPHGVEIIYNFAFRYSELEKIILPDTVTAIKNSAFYRCENLFSVNIPDSVTKIDGNAFHWCKKLKSISVPAGVNKIEFNVFDSSDALTEFEFKGEVDIWYGWTGKDLIKHIEQQLSGEFHWANSEAYLLACLKQFPRTNDKPNQLKAALDENLQRFIAAAKRGNRPNIVEFLNSLKPDSSQKNGALNVTVLSDTEAEIENYTGEEEIIEIPSVIEGRKIVSIGPDAFKDNFCVTRIIIPDGVTKIGSGAFSGCKSLKNINLPNGLTVLSKNIFCDCVSLETLELPKTLTHIENAALKNCEKLGSLILPDGLLSLGKESLYGCLFNHGPKLETTWGYTLAEFTIPASVEKISGGGHGLFARYPAAEDKFGVFEYKIKLRVVKNSAAHKFAAKNRIKFILLSMQE